jgi:acetolactate synthase-1/2/3 large subunit
MMVTSTDYSKPSSSDDGFFFGTEQVWHMSKERTGAQVLWESLISEGVQVVFGYPGGAILPAYDAMLDYPIRHVLVRHEQGATHMADGYARATGRVGVVMGTSGPGATNMVTGIATAMMDSSPLVCITGQVATSVLGTDAFQEVDIVGITLPITKQNYQVRCADDIARTIREAFAVASTGRPGPVLVDITKDAQQGECRSQNPQELPPSRLGSPRCLRMTGLDPIALINTAERPVILAGHGIIVSNAEHELRAFAERAQIPVAVTLLGIGGFPASHPLSLGMMGMHGEAWVNTAIQEADLLVAIGMRFDDRVTGNLTSYSPNSKKIHVDIDASEFNKNVAVHSTIEGDAGDVLRAWLPQTACSNRHAWLSDIDRLKGDCAVRDIQNMPDDGHLYAAHVIHDLWRITDGRAIVVTDVGQHQMWEAQYYKHDSPRTLITSGGLGTMGFALPAAIGAKIGRPDAEVWVVAGDGGFQMTMPELMTMVQEDLDIKIAIINNGFLGMVRQWQEFFYGRRYAATPISSPDFVKLAQSFGVWAAAVESRREAASVINEARTHKGALIEFRVEQEDSVYPMVAGDRALHEMIRRPSRIVEQGAD